MGKRNRRQREARRREQELLAAQQTPAAEVAEVQTPAPQPGLAPMGVDISALRRVAERELMPDEPVQGKCKAAVDSFTLAPIDTPKPPRKFGKARVFNLDCGITVTVKGDEETLESEVWPVFEGNELHIYTGDAAIERRIAKQQGIAMPVPAAAAAVSPSPAPEISAEAMAVPGRDGYNGIGPRPKLDPEQDAFNQLGLAGISVDAMKRSTTIGAQLAAVPDGEI